MDRRVDLQIARIEVELLGKSYGLTRATHFINVLDASGISKTQKDQAGRAAQRRRRVRHRISGPAV